MSSIPLIKNKKARILIITFLGCLVILALVILLLSDSKFHQRTYPSGNGWGYEIVYKKKVTIHQEFIPCITGNTPFASKNDAEKTAKLVIQKLEEGKIPSITMQDLEELKIIATVQK
jgi:hypothetical protein